MSTNTSANTTRDDQIRRFETYLKADPENPMLWINLGDLYHQAGRFEEAEACFEKCLLFDKENLVARGRLANVFISQHRFSDAEQNLRDVIEESGEDPSLLHNLGLSIYYQSRFEEAQQLFAMAKDRGLTAPKNLAYLIYSLHNSNQIEEAMALTQAWQQESPGPATEGYIALLEMDHGDMESACRRAEQVIQQQAGNADANVVLGTWQLEHQEIKIAENHFLQAVRSEPDNPRSWQGLGLVHMYQQNFPEALKALEHARSLIPGNATIHLIIGWAYLANQDAKNAEQSFRKAIAASPSFGESYGGLACALALQNRLEEAKVEIKRARGLDPDGFGAVFAQSVSLQLRGEGEKGTKLFAQLLQQQPVPRSKPIIEHILDYLRGQGRIPAAKPEDPKNGQHSPGQGIAALGSKPS